MGFAGEGDSEIITYDGGRSWSMNPGFSDLKKACFVDSLNGFGITDNNFYQTFDGGANWVSIRDSLECTRFFILECVNGKVFVVGNKSFHGAGYWYVSDDVGASWEMRYQQDSTLFLQGRFVDDQNIFGFSVSHQFNLDFSRTMWHYYKSDDGGYTWQTIDFLPSTNTSHGVFCPDADTCFSVASRHGLGLPSFRINQLDFTAGKDSAFVYQQQEGLRFMEGFDKSLFIGGSGYLSVSPDRGANWFTQNISFLSPGIQRMLFACHVFSDSSAVITGADGVIIFTENFGLGLTGHKVTSPTFSVFPNPVSGHQEISVSGIIPGTNCVIEIFDLQGKKVKQVFSGISPDKDLNIQVKLGDLATGSYFYRIQTEEGVGQKKIVVQ